MVLAAPASADDDRKVWEIHILNPQLQAFGRRWSSSTAGFLQYERRREEAYGSTTWATAAQGEAAKKHLRQSANRERLCDLADLEEPKLRWQVPRVKDEAVARSQGCS